eukprot:2947092-Pyramimonas_sp.AAC.1
MGARKRYPFRSCRHLASQAQMQAGLRQVQGPKTTMSGVDFRNFAGCQLKIGGQSISVFGIYLTSEVGAHGMNVTNLIQL